MANIKSDFFRALVESMADIEALLSEKIYVCLPTRWETTTQIMHFSWYPRLPQFVWHIDWGPDTWWHELTTEFRFNTGQLPQIINTTLDSRAIHSLYSPSMFVTVDSPNIITHVDISSRKIAYLQKPSPQLMLPGQRRFKEGGLHCMVLRIGNVMKSVFEYYVSAM
jgi:hypothetical protein